MKTLDKIKILRTIKRISQKTMGEKLHLSEAAYNKIENGETDLSIQRLAKIAEILDVDTQDLTSNNPINIVFSQQASNGIFNNSQNDFIEYLKQELVKREQQIEMKNTEIQILKEEIKTLKQINS